MIFRNEFDYFCSHMTSGIKRIIPSLYTSDGQFSPTESRNYILDYNQALEKALAYEAAGADQIIIMDVTTLTERRRNLPRFLKDVVKTIKIPVVFGGGIHTVRDVEDMLKLGIKKLYVNSAAVRNPELINKISRVHGKETLLVGVDTRQTFGTWKVYLNGGKSRTEIDLLNWIEVVQHRGGGEILLSTIGRSNLSHEVIKEVLTRVLSVSDIPVIASLGADNAEELIDFLQTTDLNGIVSAHLFSKDVESIQTYKALMRSHGIPTGDTTELLKEKAANSEEDAALENE